EETLTSIQWLLFHSDDYTLAALDSLAHNSKSLIIAFALWKRHLTVEQAIKASRVEEDYQQQYWGEVVGAGGHDVDKANVTVRMAAANLFLSMLPQKPTPSIR